jgi:hypothetical protein
MSMRALILYKIGKRPLANAKPAEKGTLIYRCHKQDLPTAKAHFKGGVLIYKIANRDSQSVAPHHVNKGLFCHPSR